MRELPSSGPMNCSVPYCDKRATLALPVKRAGGQADAVYCACNEHQVLVRDHVEMLRAIISPDSPLLPTKKLPWWRMWP